jgi:GGDEF domain-containing protein
MVLLLATSSIPNMEVQGEGTARGDTAQEQGRMGQTDLLNKEELGKLERRSLQVTVLSVVFVLVLAGGLAVFMYPLVFEHPEGNKWTLRVAFFGFCGLTLLFVGYLLDQQKTLRQLKLQLLAEVERNIALKHQANVDLLGSMPDATQFFDRLTMEFRRAKTMEKTLSLVLLKVNPAKGTKPDMTAVCSAAAKGMSRRLRPTDSIFRLAPELFGVMLPETDKMNGQRVAMRLQEELQAARAAFNVAFELSVFNYREDVVSAHEMEDLVKSLMPEQPGWEVAAPATALVE